jgi:isoleucyl-tRNA synthetase
MPFAQYHFLFENGIAPQNNADSAQNYAETFPRRSALGLRNSAAGLAYPADYICEAIDQTRGWFYTLLAIATLLEFGPPYRNVISTGHVLDEKGEKMSKSKGNAVDPWTVLEKFGADAVRWYFFTVNAPGEPKLFALKDVEAAQRRMIGILWNSLEFLKMYQPSKIRNPKSEIRNKSKTESPKSTNALDRWIVARLHQLIQEVTKRLDEYDVTTAARAVETFAVEDLSQWYIRRSRRRFQKPASQKEKDEAVETLRYVLA